MENKKQQQLMLIKFPEACYLIDDWHYLAK